MYIRFLYKVDVRICCALLKNVLNSRNDAGLPAAGACAVVADGVGCCLAACRLPLALHTDEAHTHLLTHTHTRTQISNIIERSVRRAKQPGY